MSPVGGGERQGSGLLTTDRGEVNATSDRDNRLRSRRHASGGSGGGGAHPQSAAVFAIATGGGESRVGFLGQLPFQQKRRLRGTGLIDGANPARRAFGGASSARAIGLSGGEGRNVGGSGRTAQVLPALIDGARRLGILYSGATKLCGDQAAGSGSGPECRAPRVEWPVCWVPGGPGGGAAAEPLCYRTGVPGKRPSWGRQNISSLGSQSRLTRAFVKRLHVVSRGRAKV